MDEIRWVCIRKAPESIPQGGDLIYSSLIYRSWPCPNAGGGGLDAPDGSPRGHYSQGGWIASEAEVGDLDVRC